MSYITNFEATGLEAVNKFLTSRFPDKDKFQFNNGDLTGSEKEALRQLLMPTNVSFCLEGVNRLQTTLLCELKLSYTQQSQRYVNMFYTDELDKEIERIAKKYEPNEGKKVVENVKNIYKKLFNLYERMSETKDAIKGRPRIEDYKYGIPIEDARYILPLNTQNNITISMNGSKLIELFELFNSKDYFNQFTDIMFEIGEHLPPKVFKALRCCVKEESIINFDNYYIPMFDKISSTKPVVYFSDFEDGKQRVAIGAWTSSMKSTPSQLIEKYADNIEEKEEAVINRVLGYGHQSIIEHYRNTFGFQMSLTAYHQFVRHRLNDNYVQPLHTLLKTSHEVVIPKTIQDSPFIDEYMELIREVAVLRKTLPMEEALKLLLNCEVIKVISSSNARNDCRITYDRICNTAQWEIRDLYTKKFDILYEKYPDFYKYGLPPCVYGGCKEGTLTCGNPTALRDKYKKV